jgi:hypothetical protein
VGNKTVKDNGKVSLILFKKGISNKSENLVVTLSVTRDLIFCVSY